MTWQHDRRSRHERGYGAKWDKLRAKILKRDSFVCQCDDCKGGELRVRPASEVDHRIGKAEWQRRFGNLDGCDDESNLQAIHPDCHAAKTQRESGNPSRIVGADVDGWPLEAAATCTQPKASADGRSTRLGPPDARAEASRLTLTHGGEGLRQEGVDGQDRPFPFQSAPPLRRTNEGDA